MLYVHHDIFHLRKESFQASKIIKKLSIIFKEFVTWQLFWKILYRLSRIFLLFKLKSFICKLVLKMLNIRSNLPGILFSLLFIIYYDNITLYSGLSFMGTSHSPSISSSQSSGFLASGSGISFGWSQSEGFSSSGSSIVGLSSQSDGLDWDGSLIFFGGRKSQSSSSWPDSTFSLSIKTYKKVNYLEPKSKHYKLYLSAIFLHNPT